MTGVVILPRGDDRSSGSRRGSISFLIYAQGFSTAQIAETLQLPDTTAPNHIRLLLAKLCVRMQPEAVVVVGTTRLELVSAGRPSR
jgi:DNA-binding NarL/FixJ family response regulator